MEVEEIISALREGGFEIVALGEEEVKALIASVANGSIDPRCSGYRVFPNGDKCPGCGDCTGPDKIQPCSSTAGGTSG
jgi:hypothetical protein